MVDMVYCVVGFSFTPKYCPLFMPTNEDGSDFVFKGRSLRDGSRLPWNLDLGFRITARTNPSVDSVYRFAKLTNQCKTPPDMFLLPGPVPCVSQSVHDCIESIEPNVHQFFPIALLKSKMQAFDGAYFIMNICKMLDSLIFEKTSLRLSNREPVYVFEGSRRQILRTIKGSMVENRHLWREKKYPHDYGAKKKYPHDLYLSDDLHKLFQKKKFKGIDKHNYIKVIVES